MRLPTMFVTHGGGPMPILGDQSQASVANFLRGAAQNVPERPKAIVCVTGHWEEPTVTVSTSPAPPMLYDYYGFPPAAYELVYKAPGSPLLANRVIDLLKAAGIPAKTDSKRGYDHGTFVPLMLMYPDADIPVVQMSLNSDMDPKAHIELGRALSPLRDEGVLILGSGSSYHNMGELRRSFANGMQGKALEDAQAFHAYLRDTCTTKSGEERDAALIHWESAPGARQSHPREEHLLPLHIAAGAARDGRGKVIEDGSIMGSVPALSFLFSD